MPKLSDTQRVIMSAAAGRGDRTVLPLPKSLKIKGGAITTVLESLIRRDLIAERPAGRNDELWREAGGQRITLVITSVGLDTIGVDADQSPDRAAATANAKSKRQSRKGAGVLSQSGPGASRLGSKKALLVDLRARKGGATVAEIGEATGWQPHSVRGAISGGVKKKLGLTVESGPVEGRGRVYRIVARV